MSSSLSEINTKLEAYKLIYDPAKLLSLLYSKYGDIEDDYNIMHIDQLIFNKTTHFNHLFKENINFNNWNEYMRRIYNKKEHDERIVKLADYYKNYYLFFCRPVLTEINYLYFLNKYYNRKAKIFYKNYNSQVNSENSDFNNKETESIVTSINNDTNNKIIFNKKNRFIIENDSEKSKYSITLTYDDINNNNYNEFINKSSASSFENFLRYFIDECKFENYENKNNRIEKNINSNNEQKKSKLDKNNIKNLDLNNYLINTKNIKEILQDFNKDKKNGKLLKENDAYNKIRKNIYNINCKENSNEISRNISTMNLSANEKRKNHKLNNKNNEVIINEKNNLGECDSAKIKKNVSKLKLDEKEIKDGNPNQVYINKKDLSNHQNLKEDYLNNLHYLKKQKDINSIKKLKLNNKIYNNINIKTFSIYKNIPNNIKNNKEIEKKFVSKNINNKNVISNNRLDFKHNEIKNVKKIISYKSNNIYSTSYKLNKNHKNNNNKEILSSKVISFTRNKIILKRN
jgi:predicted transcriptional regulator